MCVCVCVGLAICVLSMYVGAVAELDVEGGWKLARYMYVSYVGVVSVAINNNNN